MNPATSVPELGAVVVTYCSSGCLEDCLRGLRPILDAGALTVVDNASPDDSAAVAAALWPGADVVRMPRNAGYAAGVNEGLRRQHRPFLLVLNPDTLIDPDGVRLAVDWLRAHPDFGMAGPRLRGADGAPQASCYAEPTLRGMAAAYLLRHAGEPAPLARLDGALEVEGLVGAALLVRRAALERVGPMDEDFWLFSEEVDWCARFRSAGFRLALLPAWTLTHLGGASTATLPVHRDVLAHRGRHLYFLKHGGPRRAALFRLLLAVSLPWVAAVAGVNALIGRVTWSEAGRRVSSQAAAAASPRQEVPAC
jgi:GT2 family glycosyltransferase